MHALYFSGLHVSVCTFLYTLCAFCLHYSTLHRCPHFILGDCALWTLCVYCWAVPALLFSTVQHCIGVHTLFSVLYAFNELYVYTVEQCLHLIIDLILHVHFVLSACTADQCLHFMCVLANSTLENTAKGTYTVGIQLWDVVFTWWTTQHKVQDKVAHCTLSVPEVPKYNTGTLVLWYTLVQQAPEQGSFYPLRMLVHAA